ncbi:hypothetical protein HYW60_02880 [Candidatus Kaiserbacteria bacterium]|nr:hypothetical protein [Candidatus Kaiserbacteria bacterium]
MLLLAVFEWGEPEQIPKSEVDEGYITGRVYDREDMALCTAPQWAEVFMRLRAEPDDSIEVVNFLAQKIVCVSALSARFKYLGSLEKDGGHWMFSTREEDAEGIEAWWTIGEVELLEGTLKVPGSSQDVVHVQLDRHPIRVYILGRTHAQQA